MWALIITLAFAPAAEARTAYDRGRALYEQGEDMPGARAALDEAIRLAPDFAGAYLWRAIVIAHDGGYAPARADFERATALGPGDKEIWREHAMALTAAGDAVRAEAYFYVAIALDRRDGPSWYELGRLYRKMDRLDYAVSAFERDAQLEPSGSAHHELGEIFLSLGIDKRAERELELDLAADATCYESRVNLAGLALERGDADKARLNFEQSLLYHPGDARALAGLGRAYLELGDHELAVGTLRAAADLAPDDRRVADALSSARWHLRLEYGWPLLILGAAVAAGLALVIYRVRMRKRPS